MTSLLARDAAVLVTMDEERREIPDGAIYAEDGFIVAAGATSDLPDSADEVIDLSGQIVLPGLVNTHHHFYQTLTRAVPGAQDAGLFEWLRTLYPIWARMSAEHIRVSTQVALAELALSGCTTAFDHLYLFPNDSTLDDEVVAARDVGIRLVASRGSMSLGESAGGLPPDAVVETEDAILEDCARVVDAFHEPGPGAMTQIVIAPCSPFSVTTDLMRAAAALAREKGVRLHTHLAETMDEVAFCLETHGRRPVELAEDLDWAGDDVWFAHGVFINDAEIARMGQVKTGVAHCPSSNMRLASGVAPVRRYLSSGVPVGLGVDGSASNDGSHLLGEARQALLLNRLAAAPSLEGGDVMSARIALELATRGGAEVLGRRDIGSLEPGKCADFVALRLDRLDYAGALHDPVAAAVLCAPVGVELSVVGGRKVVEGGRLLGLEVPVLVERHNRLAAGLLDG
ncbi:MAG TPA: 8-oxoguanine deaminase [Acidimicrobiia bacterium]|jgi:cytosine/adenosine deaminase-related metal-dependent hydrolase|nr:8-oxoguanine deaminase [Acidimicrobiia bacterium]